MRLGGVRRAVAAVLYREVVWFRRWFLDYVAAWIMPLVLGSAVLFLPMATGASLQSVLTRVSRVLGVGLDLRSAVIYSLTLSSLISMVSAVVGDVSQTLINELRIAGTADLVLECLDLPSYLVGVALVRSTFLSIASTLYLLPTYLAVEGLSGLGIYAAVLVTIVLSGIALGFYTLALTITIVRLVDVSRPWTLSNLLVPLLLAGSGMYVPVTLVPLALRLFAYTSPLPELCKALRSIVLHRAGLTALLSTTILLTLLYVVITGVSARSYWMKVVKG